MSVRYRVLHGANCELHHTGHADKGTRCCREDSRLPRRSSLASLGTLHTYCPAVLGLALPFGALLVGDDDDDGNHTTTPDRSVILL